MEEIFTQQSTTDYMGLVRVRAYARKKMIWKRGPPKEEKKNPADKKAHHLVALSSANNFTFEDSSSKKDYTCLAKATTICIPPGMLLRMAF